MELGQKIRQTRLELGLSQRQLCGDTITRNMLSLIENGSATPSMDTLRFLAARLEKPVSFFLEEDAVTSPNQTLICQARETFARGDHRQVLKLLEGYARPDALFDWEEALLRSLAALSLGEEALAQQKAPYALELLEQAAAAGEQTPYYTQELERRRLLSLAQLRPTELPEDDRELRLRAKAALEQQDPEAAGRYLDACQDRSSPQWHYWKGQSLLGQGDFAMAKVSFEAAWDHSPKACAAFLEQCCRELEDYRGAYHYACLLREQ